MLSDMKKDPALSNAFLDLCLVGVIFLTIGLIWDLASGDGVEPPLVGAALLTLGAYFVGALRLGTSPSSYLRTVWKRGSLPTR
jgi:hypothetical protein